MKIMNTHLSHAVDSKIKDEFRVGDRVLLHALTIFGYDIPAIITHYVGRKTGYRISALCANGGFNAHAEKLSQDRNFIRQDRTFLRTDFDQYAKDMNADLIASKIKEGSSMIVRLGDLNDPDRHCSMTNTHRDIDKDTTGIYIRGRAGMDKTFEVPVIGRKITKNRFNFESFSGFEEVHSLIDSKVLEALRFEPKLHNIYDFHGYKEMRKKRHIKFIASL